MTNQAIVKVNNAVIESGRKLGWDESDVQLIKDTVAKGTTDAELMIFLHIAKRSGLDPFARQIYCIKRWDGTLNREVATPQTSIDGYRLIADRTGTYTPGKDVEYGYDSAGNLIKATAYVLKLVAGEWREIGATAFLSEYMQTKKDGSPTAMWKKMPHLMLGKCAESLALRKAFPAELSGIYTADEIGVSETPHVRPIPAGIGEVIEADVIDADPVIKTIKITKSMTPEQIALAKIWNAMADAGFTESEVYGCLPDGVTSFKDLDDTNRDETLERMSVLLDSKREPSKLRTVATGGKLDGPQNAVDLAKRDTSAGARQAAEQVVQMLKVAQ